MRTVRLLRTSGKKGKDGEEKEAGKMNERITDILYNLICNKNNILFLMEIKDLVKRCDLIQNQSMFVCFFFAFAGNNALLLMADSYLIDF